jgi:hypothetical protein
MIIKVHGVACIMNMVLCYTNETASPLEISVKLPYNKEFTIGKLSAKMGDTEVTGKILEKSKAEERYEDSMGAGHTAFMA